MSRNRRWRNRVACLWLPGILAILLPACGPETVENPPQTELVPPASPVATAAASPTVPPTATPPPTQTPTATPSPSATPSPTLIPSPTARLQASVDLAGYQAARQGAWFSTPLQGLPQTPLEAEVVFTVQDVPVANRRGGQIAPTLVARYLFLQFEDLRLDLLAQYAPTIRALFIRSALMSFVDYEGNRVLDWDGRSSPIPLDPQAVIGLANRLGIPVYLELNYSRFVPGPEDTGPEALQPADNVARTLDYLRRLRASGLRVEGVTFGDEIEDDSGFGTRKPTLQTADIAARFVEFAAALKAEFPDLKVYAFDSYIAAARGKLSLYFPLFERIRQAEVRRGQILLHGFLFRESYVYVDEDGRLMDSQRILDDTDSLWMGSPVYRYDSLGRSYRRPDRDYLNTLLRQTDQVFGRNLEVGLSEYLPAGPTEIDESDTTPYADIDFTLHYADLVGIYGRQGRLE